MIQTNQPVQFTFAGFFERALQRRQDALDRERDFQLRESQLAETVRANQTREEDVDADRALGDEMVAVADPTAEGGMRMVQRRDAARVSQETAAERVEAIRQRSLVDVDGRLVSPETALQVEEGRRVNPTMDFDGEGGYEAVPFSVFTGLRSLDLTERANRDRVALGYAGIAQQAADAAASRELQGRQLDLQADAQGRLEQQASFSEFMQANAGVAQGVITPEQAATATGMPAEMFTGAATDYVVPTAENPLRFDPAGYRSRTEGGFRLGRIPLGGSLVPFPQWRGVEENTSRELLEDVSSQYNQITAARSAAMRAEGTSSGWLSGGGRAQTTAVIQQIERSITNPLLGQREQSALLQYRNHLYTILGRQAPPIAPLAAPAPQE
ncbi:MAG: hypothetical protein AAGF99_00415 [Bacteroidota bacterium]